MSGQHDHLHLLRRHRHGHSLADRLQSLSGRWSRNSRRHQQSHPKEGIPFRRRPEFLRQGADLGILRRRTFYNKVSSTMETAPRHIDLYTRHGGRLNYSFVDGHVEAYPWAAPVPPAAFRCSFSASAMRIPKSTSPVTGCPTAETQ
ncbi:MAG: hypothetical protein L6W00_29335 [Lentisphaeria bacterium]|nr:MAG: hypothetical protein L6W00_29335 [Lentisphaeria bacterium]